MPNSGLFYPLFPLSTMWKIGIFIVHFNLLLFFNYFPFFLQEIKDEQQSTQTSSKVKKKEHIKPDSSIQNDQTAMLDTRVRQLKDQIIRAKVYLYFPAARNNPHFTRELQGRMKEVQRVLGDVRKDSELPRK